MEHPDSDGTPPTPPAPPVSPGASRGEDGALRFLHTSDWQLGLRAGFIPGDAGALVRDARLETVRRIGRVAAETRAAFVVVAGDVFEHHEVAPAVVRKTLEALAGYPCSVYLLPGNHDPSIAHGIYRSPKWKWPEHVHVLATPEPVRVTPRPGQAAPLPREPVWLLPAPWLEYDSLRPFWQHLTADFGRQEDQPRGFRVGVAHGGNAEILASLQGTDVGNPDPFFDADSRQHLPSTLPDDADLDYLAVGDWHGLLRVGPRYHYPGTPEATRFDEKDPGHVLLVTIPRPRRDGARETAGETATATGAEVAPSVEPLRVATHRWLTHEVELTEGADVDALDAWLKRLPERHDTLLELHLRGTLSLTERARLERDVLVPARESLRFLRVRDEALHAEATEDDLDALEREGWVGRMVQRLRQEAPTDPEAAAALQLAFRLHQEGTP